MQDLTGDEYLHIFQQTMWHDDAYLIGNRTALEALKAKIDIALEHGASYDSAGGFFQNDGEGYTIGIICADNLLMQDINTAYTDEVAFEEASGPAWESIGKMLGEAPDFKLRQREG